MKKLVVILLTILMFFTLFQGALSRSIVKADESYKWVPKNNGLQGKYFESLAIDPINANTIYAGTDGSGVFKSINGGGSWSTINNGLPHWQNEYSDILSLVIDPKNTNTIYVGTRTDGIFKSTDGGKTWKAVNNGLRTGKASGVSIDVEHLAIDSQNSKLIYASVAWGSEYRNNEFLGDKFWGSSIFSSTDEGENWAQRDNGLVKPGTRTDVGGEVVADPINANTIYAIGSGLYASGKLFKSTNGGAYWNLIGSVGGSFSSLVIDHKNTNVMYVGKWQAGILKSIDGGRTWKSINNGLSDIDINIWDILAIDPKNTNVIYAGAFGNIYKSTSGGNSWTLINNGLPDPDDFFAVVSLAIDPKNTSTVYASINDPLTNNNLFKCTFVSSTFTINASADQGGSILPSGSVIINYGNSKTFTITPDSGYYIKYLLVDGKLVGALSPYTFTDVIINHTISATFEEEITNKTVIVLQIGNLTFTVSGSTNTLDSMPVIKNSRTLLPIRAVVETLGGTVDWDESSKKVTVSLGSTTIELWIGESNAKVNSLDTPIDSTNSKVVPEIINGRTMIPLRFVTENLGCDVQWNGTTQTITITYPK